MKLVYEEFDSKNTNILSASVAVIQFSSIDRFFSELFLLPFNPKDDLLSSFSITYSLLQEPLSVLSSFLLLSTTVF